MRRALLLARHFPPIGGAGVHRTLGSVRHLPEHGYQPIVVTGPGDHRDRWNPHDPELLAAVPAGIEVHRLDGPEPGPRSAVLTRVDGLRQVPPPWEQWWVERSRALGRRVGADVDVVVASCLPYHTSFAGAALAGDLGVPWIADLEDPWALDEMRTYPTGLHRRRELRRMRTALQSAAAIVMCASEAAVRIRCAFPELAARVHAIPIGYEPADFDVAASPDRDDDVLRIVHSGSMHTDFGLQIRRTRARRRLLGGTYPGVDILPRSHVFLCEAIASLVEAEPSLRGRVELHLAGDLTPGDRAIAQRHEFTRLPGLLTHRETVRLMRSADLLFLPMQDLPPGSRAGLIPYKTYEYLAAGRSVVAAVPDGDVRDMLAPLAHVSLVRPTDTDAMKAVLRAHLADLRARRALRREPPPELMRSACVARIAEVLDCVLAGTSARQALPAR